MFSLVLHTLRSSHQVILNPAGISGDRYLINNHLKDMPSERQRTSTWVNFFSLREVVCNITHYLLQKLNSLRPSPLRESITDRILNYLQAFWTSIMSDCRTAFFPQTLHLHVIFLTVFGKSATVTILVFVLVLQPRQDFPHTLKSLSSNFLPLQLIWILQTFIATQVRLTDLLPVT